jgi:hypothetical protein
MTKHPPSIGFNIQVYGAVQQVAGNVTIDYTIDGSFAETVTLSPTSQGVNSTNWELNRLLFGYSNKTFYGDEETEHTLEVTVKEVSGDQVRPNVFLTTLASSPTYPWQVFSLDYLTFEGTAWTNVTSGRALPSRFGESKSLKRNLAIGLGASLPLALIIAVGLFFFFRRKFAFLKKTKWATLDH